MRLHGLGGFAQRAMGLRRCARIYFSMRRGHHTHINQDVLGETNQFIQGYERTITQKKDTKQTHTQKKWEEKRISLYPPLKLETWKPNKMG